MAGKGGYEAPKGPRPPSGPGRFSQRDEQPMLDRDLDDPNMQYGDRKALRAAQQAAPLPNKRTPAPRPAPSRGAPAPRRPNAGGGLPSSLFERPTNRPMEPEMTPASIQPEPDDERELLLQALYENFPGDDTLELLNRFRGERADGGLGGVGGGGAAPAPEGTGRGSAPAVPTEPSVDEALALDAAPGGDLPGGEVPLEEEL